MNWPHGSQIHIKTLMLLIGAIACTLALVQWVGMLLAITIGVFPASLVAEAIMGTTHPVPRSQPSRGDAVPTLIGLILCASCARWPPFFHARPARRQSFRP